MEENIKTDSELKGDRKKKCRELKFIEKVLVRNDIPGESEWKTARLYGLKKFFPNFPGCGERISVIDCETGDVYETHMDNNNEGLISAGLTDIWRYDNRGERFHLNDVIGLALEFDTERGPLLYVCFKYQEIKNKKVKGDMKVSLRLVSEEDVQKGSIKSVPIMDTKMIDNYERLAREGKLKIYRVDLFASEVNYGSLSIPEDARYQKVLDKWRDNEVTCGDLRTGWRKTNRHMRDQQNWINGLTEFWSQYPFLQEIARKYKGTGEKDKIIGKKLFGFLSNEGGVLEIVFTPELDEDKKPPIEDKKPLIEEKKPLIEEKIEENKPIVEEKKKDISSENEFVTEMYAMVCALVHQISKTMFDNIYISLKTVQIILLGGTNGIGKNKIIELIARLVSKNFKDQFHIMPVGPEFHDSKTIMVKYNAAKDKYEPTPLLEMLSRALKYIDEHHFFIFDEGNIAHPEQYAAAILSAIETLKELPLPAGYIIKTKYGEHHDKIHIPKNISFIFTMNMDETTHKLAPKTIDRAIFIDMSEIDTEEFFDLIAKTENSLTYEEVEGKFADMFKKYFIDDEIRKYERAELVRAKIFRDYIIKNRGKFIFFKNINEKLKGKSLRGFAAYRMMIDTACYMNLREKLDSKDLSENTAMDFIMIQKILPMVKPNEGSGDVLKFLREFSEENDCPMSVEKIDRMLKGLNENDFTEFCR